MCCIVPHCELVYFLSLSIGQHKENFLHSVVEGHSTVPTQLRGRRRRRSRVPRYSCRTRQRTAVMRWERYVASGTQPVRSTRRALQLTGRRSPAQATGDSSTFIIFHTLTLRLPLKVVKYPQHHELRGCTITVVVSSHQRLGVLIPRGTYSTDLPP